MLTGSYPIGVCSHVIVFVFYVDKFIPHWVMRISHVIVFVLSVPVGVCSHVIVFVCREKSSYASTWCPMVTVDCCSQLANIDGTTTQTT